MEEQINTLAGARYFDVCGMPIAGDSISVGAAPVYMLTSGAAPETLGEYVEDELSDAR